MSAHKLRVKLGAYEFEAEGSEETVRSQFEEFKQLVESRRPSADISADKLTVSNGLDINTDDSARGTPNDLSRLFSDQKGLVTLKILPASKERYADSALLLLHGFKSLKGLEDVPVTILKAALEKSGCQVARVDRILQPYVDARFILKGGLGKGGKYQLTNTGLVKADEIARNLMNQMV